MHSINIRTRFASMLSSLREKRALISALVLAALVAVLSAGRADAQYIFTTLDDPSATVGYYPNGGTQAYGIYGNTVVGTYWSGGKAYGFSETGGAYTTLVDTNGNNTYAYGISGNTVVGLYITPSLTSYGYSETGGGYTTLSAPSSTLTYAVGIYNPTPSTANTNTIVGVYQDGTGNHGYSEIGGVYTTIDDPNALAGTGPQHGDGANGIYGNTIVGNYWDAAGQHGFMETGGVYTPIEDPNAPDFTQANGIYETTIVGDYTDSTNTEYGFIETGGVYTTIDVPGSISTQVYGIYGNTIVGTFSDGTGDHGFTATLEATPEPGSLALLTSLGIAGSCLLIRRRRK